MFGIVEPILIVDDDQSVQETIMMAFEDDPDKKCFVANSTEMALQIIDENDIFVVITDIKMPGPDGIELCRMIHERKIPVGMIMMTGFKGIENLPDILDYGVSHLLEKPFKLETLRELTDNLIIDQLLHELEQRVMKNVAKQEDDQLNYRQITKKERIQFLMQLANKDLI